LLISVFIKKGGAQGKKRSSQVSTGNKAKKGGALAKRRAFAVSHPPKKKQPKREDDHAGVESNREAKKQKVLGVCSSNYGHDQKRRGGPWTTEFFDFNSCMKIQRKKRGGVPRKVKNKTSSAEGKTELCGEEVRGQLS